MRASLEAAITKHQKKPKLQAEELRGLMSKARDRLRAVVKESQALALERISLEAEILEAAAAADAIEASDRQGP